MTAAAKHLTPVTLELGGKSPCFVDKDSDLELAARRIAWGKCVNAGQTLFGDDPHVSGRFAHIVNEHHYERLLSIFNSQLSSVSITADVVQVGDPNKHDLFFPFAAFKVHGNAADGFESVARENPAMRDENFGPILPIVEVERVEDGIDFSSSAQRVSSRPTPLALYVFSGNPSSKFVRTILDRTNSGGVCVNDTLMHLAGELAFVLSSFELSGSQPALPGLPFGGVGPSGMGRYRGKHGFDAFSHDRAVLVRSQSRLVEAAMKLRYAPYTDRRTDLVKWLVFGIRNTELSWFGRVVTRYWWSVLKSTVVAAAYVAVGVTIGRRLA
ncbi:MAG: aldehyde dehydrogenase 3 family, member A2, isoform CRA_c [Olpidium bornovanus]|uniref:Aldehyde dehydrogenase 3 family, member A2, isoform CRA_c n=1 Tax=Olpidium bornovanus TaxID=278681 RepID=A0A8H8DFV5_9FUNG|nr:MAG: aldehyde dehydrogenase 3 family, member A2, isoform CRA_c [Olpidium bornovanus]